MRKLRRGGWTHLGVTPGREIVIRPRKERLYEIEVRRRPSKVKVPEGMLKPRSIDDIAEVASAILAGRMQESIVAIHFDAEERITGFEEVAIGGFTQTGTEAMNILRGALCSGAHHIALVHNHPALPSTPSPQDIEFTENVGIAAKRLEMPIVDHLVIGEDGFTSIRAGAQAGALGRGGPAWAAAVFASIALAFGVALGANRLRIARATA